MTLSLVNKSINVSMKNMCNIMTFLKSIKYSITYTNQIITFFLEICKAMQILKFCGRRILGCVSLTYVYVLQLYMQNMLKASDFFSVAEFHNSARVFRELLSQAWTTHTHILTRR